VTASTSPDAPVVEIVATGTSATRTADVANAVARSLAEYGSDRKADTRVDLSLLAAAMTPTAPSSPKPPLELLVGAAAGLLVGGLAVLAGVGRPDAPAGRAAQAPTAAEGDNEPVTYTVEVPDGELPEGRRPQDGTPEIGAPQTGAPEIGAPEIGAEGSAEIAGHVGVWRAKYGPKAITAYRSTTAAGSPEAEKGETKQVNGTVYRLPVVGRATVAGMDEDDD
jgi:hypothetical protein